MKLLNRYRIWKARRNIVMLRRVAVWAMKHQREKAYHTRENVMGGNADKKLIEQATGLSLDFVDPLRDGQWASA